METLLVGLKKWGCDVDGAVERVLGDERLLCSCIRDAAKDPSFQALGEALEAGDVSKGFEAAHRLKGMLSTTGLTKLYQPAAQIVELLRAGELAGTAEAYTLLTERLREFREILE